MSRPPINGPAYGYATNGSNPSMSSNSIGMNGGAMGSQTRLGTMSRAERFGVIALVDQSVQRRAR